MDRLLVLCPLSAMAFSALIAPRLELLTNLVCKELDGRQWDPAISDAGHQVGFVGTTRPVPCAADPAVQAKVTASVRQYLSHIDSAWYPELLDGCLLGIGTILSLSIHCVVRLANSKQFSDLYGRVWYLRFHFVPVLLTGVALMTLAIAPDKVPGGYWFLVYTSALEGLIGGQCRFQVPSLSLF
jgi:hypothetical protein